MDCLRNSWFVKPVATERRKSTCESFGSEMSSSNLSDFDMTQAVWDRMLEAVFPAGRLRHGCSNDRDVLKTDVCCFGHLLKLTTRS